MPFQRLKDNQACCRSHSIQSVVYLFSEERCVQSEILHEGLHAQIGQLRRQEIERHDIARKKLSSQDTVATGTTYPEAAISSASFPKELELWKNSSSTRPGSSAFSEKYVFALKAGQIMAA